MRQLESTMQGLGAHRLAGSEGVRLVWSAQGAVERLEDASLSQPAVGIGAECLDEESGTLERIVLRAGSPTVMSRNERLLDDHGMPVNGWGLTMDEDGEPLDEALIARAARDVAAVRLDAGFNMLCTGAENALLAGRALGRLCARADPFSGGALPPEVLAAVRHLGAVALSVGVVQRCNSEPEFQFERSWRLVEARMVACAETVREEPSWSGWPYWLSSLLQGACDVIADAAACDHRFPALMPWVGEFCSFADERLDSGAGGLLSCCLQTLALFDPAIRQVVEA